MWFSRFWNPRNRVETADQADRWTFSRLFSLIGDVSGAANVNGAGDVSIDVTVLDDSHNHTALDGRDAKFYRGLVFYDGSSIDPDITLHENILSNHASTPEGGGGTYWHIRTSFYDDINEGGNRAQIAIQYNGGAKVYARSRYSNVWTAWQRLDNAGAATGYIQTNTAADKGWRKCEVTGIIEQWGRISVAASPVTQTFNFPITFPNGLAGVFIQALDNGVFADRGGTTVADTASRTTFKVTNNAGTSRTLFWQARGH